jgi:hypothetical protein
MTVMCGHGSSRQRHQPEEAAATLTDPGSTNSSTASCGHADGED